MLISKFVSIGILLAASLFSSGDNQIRRQSNFASASPTPTSSEVEEVTLCELNKRPKAFDKKLVKVTGFAGFSFENFSFSDPTCSTPGVTIWLEYGGKTAAGSMYCCGVTAARLRKESLMVEEIPVSLTEDDNFRKFDELIHRPPDSEVRATLVGRFFSGKADNDGSGFGGYGHMGCCTLLAIEKVENVSDPDASLDSRNTGIDGKYRNKFNSYSYARDLPEGNEVIKMQAAAENGSDDWMFTDHRRLVSEYFNNVMKDREAVKNLRLAEKSAGRVVYTSKASGKRYVILVTRPYWLSFYSKNPQKIIWVIDQVVQSPYS
jgi:hypothetical protein